MKRINSYAKMVIAFCLISTLALSTGCQQTTKTSSKMKGRIAVISKDTNHEFWKTMEKGAMDAGEELDYEVTFEAPKDETSIYEQISMIEKALDDEVSAIAICPLDTEKLNPLIERANKKEVPVVAVDSDVTSEYRDSIIATDNIIAGSIAARHMADLTGSKGQIAVVSHVEGAVTAKDRNKGFIDEIKASYPNMVVVDVVYSGGEAELAKKLTKEIINKNPDLVGIYATNEGSAVGAAAAVDELGVAKDITLIGFDSSEEEIDYLKNGIIDGMMVQNPYNMGYLAVRNLVKKLNGKNIEKKINTGVTYVSLNNLNDEDTQWLLYPLGKE
ncbi:MAG: ABC transporter substrate-binding protein [Lachnospiraceae bacterium]|nr:ABC transporter substrate-binding protein [Lachnospiraceae bacterium]